MVKGIAKRAAPEDDALSMHTTPDDYQYDDLVAAQDDDLPPDYAESQTAAASAASSSTAQAQQSQQDGFQFGDSRDQHAPPQDEYAPAPVSNPEWLVRTSTVHGRPMNIKETTIRIEERLSDPYNLYAYIMDYLRMVPPKPMVYINGSHYETKHEANSDKKTKQHVVDFDIRMSFEPMLRHALTDRWWEERVVSNDEKAYRGGFYKTRAPGHVQGVQLSESSVPDLKEWCEQYCASPSKLKVFRVSRDVAGMDKALLETLIANMIRATDYRGRISITFPIENKNVDIYTPHPINRLRNSWVRFVFYFTMLWIITWPLLILTTKWWTVYTVTWNFSIQDPDPSDRRRQIKQYSCLSERDWFKLQENYIRNLVLNRFAGDADMSPEATHNYNNRASQQRSFRSSNANLNSALDAVTQGASVLNNISRGRAPDSTAWGYDR